MKTNQENIHNTNKIHRVNKYATLSIMALILALYMILSPFYGDKMDKLRHNSISKAQVIAYQVAVLISRTNSKVALNQDTLKAGRSPAFFSEQISQNGIISQNDFGQPYHYEISKITGQVKITVWSKHDFADKAEVLIPFEKL